MQCSTTCCNQGTDVAMSAERFTLVCSSVATAAGCKAARQHVDLSGAGLMFWFWAQGFIMWWQLFWKTGQQQSTPGQDRTGDLQRVRLTS